MSEGYVIEVADEIVGIIVRQAGERDYRFHSSARQFDKLDGRTYATPSQAQSAAVRHAGPHASCAGARSRRGSLA